MYIGPDKIKNSVEKDGFVQVEFESGIKATYPKAMFDATVTPDQSDDTSLRDRRVMKVMQEYVKLLLAYDLTFIEIESLNAFTTNFLSEKKQAAMAHILRPHMLNPLPDTLHPSRTVNALSIGDVDRILNGKAKSSTA